MRKRITSLLLTLAMLLSLVPALGVTASAAEDLDENVRIRVTATAAGYLGQLADAPLKVSKAVRSGYPYFTLEAIKDGSGAYTGFRINGFDGADCEYVYTNSSSAGWPAGSAAITSDTVTGLTNGTYYVFGRYKETTTQAAGTQVMTDKITLGSVIPLAQFHLDGYGAAGSGNNTIYLELGESLDLSVTAAPLNANSWLGTTFKPASGPSSDVFTITGDTEITHQNSGEAFTGRGITITGQRVGTGELRAEYISGGVPVPYGTWKVVVYDDPRNISVDDVRFDLVPSAFPDVTMYKGKPLTAPAYTVNVSPAGAEDAHQYEWRVGNYWTSDIGSGTMYVTDNGYLSVDPVTGTVTAKEAYPPDLHNDFKTVALCAVKNGAVKPLASYQVTVEEAPEVTLTGVVLSPEQVRLSSGETYQLTAAKLPADAPGDLTWYSYNPDIATVNASGLVTAVGPGYATIEVSCGGMSMTCEVLVDHTEHNFLGQIWKMMDPANHARVCNHCGDYDVQPHAFTDWEKVDDNTHKRTCTICWEPGTTVGTPYTETVSHSWQWVTEVEATLTTPGKQVQKCAQCGAVKPNCETVIPVLQSIKVENLFVPAPVTDGTAETAGTIDAAYYVADAQWLDAGGHPLAMGGKFQPGTVYSVKITLTAQEGSAFSESSTYNAITGKAPAVSPTLTGDDHTGSVVLTYTFDRTEGDTPAASHPFTDVTEGSWYEDAVIWAVDKGVTSGTGAATFSPDGICTRAQAVTFLWRAAGSPAPKASSMPFTDVPAGSWYYDAVLWAVEQGITKGTSAATFSPDLNCSRGQIVTLLWRSAKSPAAGTANPFTDVKADAYYADAVLWAVKEGVTNGSSATTFSPDMDCSRSQIVTFIYRHMTK